MNGPGSGRQPIFNLPPGTLLLLLLNLGIHGARLLLPQDLDDEILVRFAFSPARYQPGAFDWAALAAPISYQFLHLNLAHLGMNMLALVAFGSGVEQRLGIRRFLGFYLVCGVAGALAQYLAAPGSAILLIGASGAISGLFAAILRFRAARQGFWIVVVVWLLMNMLAGTTGAINAPAPVAWIAHVGGFAAGLALFGLFDRRATRA